MAFDLQPPITPPYQSPAPCSFVKDAGTAWADAVVRQHSTSADASAGIDITAAPTNLALKITADDIFISVDTAMRVRVVEETSGTVLWAAYFPANGSVCATLRDPIKAALAGKKLRILTSVAGNVAVTCHYHLEP